MKEKTKVLKTLGVVGIILLAIFVVTTQYQIAEITKKDEGQPLFVKVFADKIEGLEPLSVNFSTIVDFYDGDLKFDWDFGNGNTSKERSPTAIYSGHGEYMCNLKVTDENGGTETDSIKILVKKNRPPVVTLSVNQNNINRKFKWVSIVDLIPLVSLVYGWPGNQQKILDRIEKRLGANAWGEGRIEVTAQVSDPEDDEIVSYEWIEQTGDSLGVFGGTPILPIHVIEGNETIVIPELYTWMPFEHVITLTVKDSAGNQANATIDFKVSESVRKSNIRQFKNLFLTVFLDTIYEQYLPIEYKHLISDPIWKIVEPLNKILNKIPGLSIIWGFVVDFIANKFPRPVPVADLSCTFDDSTYDHSTTVNANGSVTNNVTISHTIKIENTDENPAKDVYLVLKNPVAGTEGLLDAIEKSEVIISLKTADASRTLYYNNVYTNGISIGDLEPGADFTGELTVTILTADENTFIDEQSYNNTLYIHQAGADYYRWLLLLQRPQPQEVEFEILT